MHKGIKIALWILSALIVLLVLFYISARFLFREKLVDYILKVEMEERIDLLRQSGSYTEDTEQYHFTYVQDSCRAREIGQFFRLDTLLKNTSSDTWNKALTLARFVSGHIPHANQSVYPEKRNAIDLWKYTQEVEPAFNCRLHSILLHELLLSEGIINRFVTCLPADSLDPDCHVVNLVWLPEHNKWAMLDSDMQAWASDTKGTPLSLSEMREYYIAGTPITYHSLLDNTDDFYYYRSYWAKNLYWFICWEETGYDKETSPSGQEVVLVPPGFKGFKYRGGSVFTSDDKRFWAAPDKHL